jgi:hypothetical protein
MQVSKVKVRALPAQGGGPFFTVTPHGAPGPSQWMQMAQVRRIFPLTALGQALPALLRADCQGLVA